MEEWFRALGKENRHTKKELRKATLIEGLGYTAPQDEKGGSEFFGQFPFAMSMKRGRLSSDSRTS